MPRGTLAAVLLFTLAQWTRAEWKEEVKLSAAETQASLNENMGHCLIARDSTLHAVWTEAKGSDSAIVYRASENQGGFLDSPLALAVAWLRLLSAARSIGHDVASCVSEKVRHGRGGIVLQAFNR